MTKATLNHFLKADSKTLGTLLTKLSQLEQWNAWLKESLNPGDPLTKHCYIVNLTGNSLIVIADSAHWVTRLRFHIPELLKKLKCYPGLENIRAICCKTQPNPQGTYKKKKRMPQQKLSTQAAQKMLDSAKKISDKKLRKQMEKIALNAFNSAN